MHRRNDPVILPPRERQAAPPPGFQPLLCNECPDSPKFALSVSIVIPCGPGYSQWVYEAAESAKRQGEGVEVIVVFDSCEPIRLPTQVRSYSVRYKSVQRTRRYGLQKATGEAILFLDADDILPPGVALKAAQQLKDAHERDPRVAGVYPNASYANIVTGVPVGGNRMAPEWNRDQFERLCFMVISTMTLRRALLASWNSTHSHIVLEDHAMWMDLVRDGWIFQKGVDLWLRVRVHPDSLSQSQAAKSYPISMDIARKPITLFSALSGRATVWPRLRDWIKATPENVRIVLCDDSNSVEFSREIRSTDWGSRDVRIYQSRLAGGPLVGDDRELLEVARAVESRVCRIYNAAIQECRTDFLLFLEDDVIPQMSPAATIGELARGFQSSVAAVSGVYRSRYDGEVLAWTGDSRHNRTRLNERTHDPYTAIDGCGFGCVLARTASLRKAPLSVPSGDWFDPFFWNALRRTGEVLHLANRVRCVHVDPERGDISPD